MTATSAAPVDHELVLPASRVATRGATARKLLAVDTPLDQLLPHGGLARGEIVTVTGATSLAIALLARTSRESAWCAAVRVPHLGLAAAADPPRTHLHRARDRGRDRPRRAAHTPLARLGRWVVGVPWGEQTNAEHLTQATDRPWPGRLPAPAPATVLRQPVAAEVLDAAGASVGVSGRGAITATPARVRFDGGPWHTVDGWAGPWPADERWWDATGRRRARFQMTTDDGTAVLLTLENGRWHLEAIYD